MFVIALGTTPKLTKDYDYEKVNFLHQPEPRRTIR